MDFIERVLNIFPDGGSGATEVAFLLLIAFAAVVWNSACLRRSLR